MAPRNDDKKEWIPKLVRPPETNPGDRTCLDLCESKVEEWKGDAIKMQEAHVMDNNRTEWFSYSSHERDVMELRILMTVYGMRIPQNAKGCPSSPFQTYRPEEKEQARKIKKVIVNNSSSTGKVFFNVIYVSAATKDEVTDEFSASEEPVFVVKNDSDCKFIDKHARVYENFEDYKANNALPKGVMLYPQNGIYSNADGDGKVALELAETPAASTFSRVMAVIDTAISIGGIALTVTGLVSGFGLVKFSATASRVIQAGSYVLSGYTVCRSIHGIYEKTSRNESIWTESLLLLSSALSAFVGGFSQKYQQQWKSLAREGKTLDQISRFQRCLFATVNIFTCVSSIASLLLSIYDALKKEAFTWHDLYRICMGAFFTANVLMKPKFVQQVFENEQKECLNEMRSRLPSDNAKTEMDNMMNEHGNSDQKAYMIRNLNVIKDHSEFFELIKETGSKVVCTADGLAVNQKINIHPAAFNGIGKDVIIDNINQLTMKMDEMKQLLNDADENVREKAQKELDKCENSMMKLIDNQKTGCKDAQSKDFERLGELIKGNANGTITPEEKQELDELKNTCSRHRKQYFLQSSSDHRKDPNYHETMNTFERENSGGKNVEEWKMEKDSLEKNFSEGKMSQEEYQQKSAEVDKEMKKAGIYRSFQREVDKGLEPTISKTFKDLKKDFNAKLPKDLDADLKREVSENIEKIDEKVFNANKSFKSAIHSFTNGQNERLCYLIDVDQVKSNLQEYFGLPTVEDITINGEKIFANMKLGDYDRLNRVLKQYESNAKEYMIAASKIANDTQIAASKIADGTQIAASKNANDIKFAGNVKTPYDMASVIEAIDKYKHTIPKPEREQCLTNLTEGRGPHYDKFLLTFNKIIDEVDKLDSTVKSQWNSPLTMAYHCWKHDSDFKMDFKKDPVEDIVHRYFIQEHENLFKTENVSVETHGQCGGVRTTYCRMFGTRIHIGFKVGPENNTASHFVK